MPTEQIKSDAADQVASELEEVVNALRALHNVAFQFGNGVTGETLANLILSIAQNEAHRLASCVKVLREGDDELDPLPHKLVASA